MRNKLNIYIYIFLIVFGFNLFPIVKVNAFIENDKNEIGVDYLKNLPSDDYIIGPGDELNVIVSRDYPELTTEAIVDGEGTIYLPKLNRIYVKGLTIGELNNTLNLALKEFIKYPSVEVLIKTYRPIRVLMKGEVESPGLQTLEGSSSLKKLKTDSESEFNNSFYFPTVFDAIRKSGGVTEFANLSNIKVIRKVNLSKGGGQKITTLNFEELLLSGNYNQNIRIYDSDIIEIMKSDLNNENLLRSAALAKLNPKFIQILVTGRVNDPGNIRASKASTLNTAIDMAGGGKVLKGPVTFIRFNNDGTIDKRRLAYKRNAKSGTKNNPYLKDGDVIYVGDSFLSATTEILNEITNPIRGIWSTYALIDALSN